MDTEQLQAFEHIVREGSFSRAAWALNLAQPTISGRIQTLEQEVGGLLFTRRGRTVALTPLGEKFLPYARRTLAVLAEGIEAVRQTREGRLGKLAIGVSESLAGQFLAPRLAGFYALCPKVEVSVRSGQGRHVIEMLRDGLAEIGLFTHCPSAKAEDLLPLLRFREPLVFVVPAQNPLAGQKSVTIEEVERQGQPFLSQDWWELPRAALMPLAELTMHFPYMPLLTARHLLKQGIGSALFPITQVAEEIANGSLASPKIVGFPDLTRDFVLVHRHRVASLSAPAATFVEILRETSREFLTSDWD